jgi:hypothetical protein
MFIMTNKLCINQWIKGPLITLIALIMTSKPRMNQWVKGPLVTQIAS